MHESAWRLVTHHNHGHVCYAGNNLGGLGAKALMPVLQGMTQLQTLVLDGTVQAAKHHTHAISH